MIVVPATYHVAFRPSIKFCVNLPGVLPQDLFSENGLIKLAAGTCLTLGSRIWNHFYAVYTLHHDMQSYAGYSLSSMVKRP